MKIHITRVIVHALMLVGLQCSGASAQPMGPIEVPPLPQALQVPTGHTLFLSTRAVGTQNYMCMPVAKRTVAWRFIGPQATVFADAGGLPQQIVTHFLSVNPAEGTLARPTWQHSVDTSRVWGRVRASTSDPSYVAPGAIAWLLLETAGTEPGPTGGAFLAQTTFIHRVNTAGGIAPASGCTNDDDIGKLALVPYVTDYFFYRASQN